MEKTGGAAGAVQPRRWTFGSAVLDESTMVLRVRGAPVDLERKSLEVLRFMLENAGKLVTKDQLLAAVWPGRIVTESVLTKCVYKLRDALGDTDQAIVTTVHGYGYRLDAPVQIAPAGGAMATVAPAASPAAPAPIAVLPAAPARRGWLGLTVTAAAVATLAFAAWLGLSQAPPADRSVAVLPFANLSDEDGSTYFTDGLHDSVIGNLARVEGLKVISRTSVMPYRERPHSLPEIAAALGVAHVVEGSVQRSGGKLRVSVQLIETATDTHVWSQEYDRELGDLFAVQADIARQVAAAVHARLTPAAQAQLERAPTRNAQAYDLYLRALEHERREDVRPEVAIALADQAVALDPEFALAHALLARAHLDLYWLGLDPREQRRESARRHAETAQRLAPDLLEARLAWAEYLYHGLRDYPAALAEFDLALRLAPGSSRARYMKAAIFRRQGRWAEALSQFEQAAALDPLNVKVIGEFAWAYALLRRYEEADRLLARIEPPGPSAIAYARHLGAFKRTGDLAPLAAFMAQVPPLDDPGCDIALSRWDLAMKQGRYREAAPLILGCTEGYVRGETLEQAPKEVFAALAHAAAGDVALATRHAEAARAALERSLRDKPDQPQNHMKLATMLALLGERAGAIAEADAAVAMVPPEEDAIVHGILVTERAALLARVGETERAFAELEQALRMPAGTDPFTVQLDPAYAGLRGDPRFETLIARRRHTPG
jgi:TolB-like protein/DNA-binding winged helix-turn-helix (wHTH) protein/Tfp pilus assembly protein PilF